MAETMPGQPADGYVRGKYMGFFMLMFMPLGIVLWIILDNPGMIGIGVVLAISIGASFENRHRNGPGDYHGAGESRGMAMVALAVASLALGVIFFVLLML